MLLLRNDPSTDATERPWAQSAGILFGQLVASRGVMVLNDPENLAHALNKTYFQHFPEEVRPKTCISRNVDEIKQFIDEQHDKVVIKPLQGSGGKNVFLVGEDERANLNQMIDAVIRDGYCVAQEYLPAAAEGDVRLFVMNGRPLKHDGKYAAFRRVNKTGDARSNMHSGGESEPVEVTDKMLRLVEIVRPKLVSDGMFLVGLDIVEDKLIEINVFSPGGLGSSSAIRRRRLRASRHRRPGAQSRIPQVLRRPHDERPTGDTVEHVPTVRVTCGVAGVERTGEPPVLQEEFGDICAAPSSRWSYR